MTPTAAAGDRSATRRRVDAMARPGPAPEVAFATGSDESVTQVRMEAFEGPLALLLALIEARELDVLSVPLGALAESYLDALTGLDGDRLGNVSAFVTVAAQLILIKSRAMLPRPPVTPPTPLDTEQDPEGELRARLLECRRFRDAGAALGERFNAQPLFRRDAEAAASAGRAGAIPPERPPLPPGILGQALQRLATVVPVAAAPAEVVSRTITMAERVAVIREALRDSETVVLQELLGGMRDRVVVAVTFLAMLELSKRREITLEQAEPWGPIVARRLAEAAADEAAIDESLESFA